MSRTRLWLVLCSISSFCLACQPASEISKASENKTLTVTGSSTVAPLLVEIGKRYESRRPGQRVDVQTGGSSRGIGDARQGLAQVGMVSRAAKAGEEDLEFFAIARDGVAIIVHRDNPVTALTDDEVRAIYRGEIRDWSALGGRAAPITVVNKAEGRSTLELFLAYFALDAKAVRATLVIGDNAQGIKTVAGNPDAIGYVSIGSAEYEAQAGVPIKLLPTAGIPAAVATVADGTFPLSRPLNLVIRPDAPAAVREFVAFCQSPEVEDLVREQLFVPLAR